MRVREETLGMYVKDAEWAMAKSNFHEDSHWKRGTINAKINAKYVLVRGAETYLIRLPNG